MRTISALNQLVIVIYTLHFIARTFIIKVRITLQHYSNHNIGKMIIGSIDECTIIKITIYLKRIKNIFCIFVLCFMFIF